MKSCRAYAVRGVAVSFALAIAAPRAASGAPAVTPPLPVCEVAVWQSRDFTTDAPSIYVANKYVDGSTEQLMDRELRAEMFEPIIKAQPWHAVSRASQFRFVFVSQAIARDTIKALRTSKIRNGPSAEACYLELYVDRQTFLGGAVQSNLMSEFTLRAFDGSVYRVANGKTFKKTKGFPAKDASGEDAANASFRAAFADNLNDFIVKKFPSKSQ